MGYIPKNARKTQLVNFRLRAEEFAKLRQRAEIVGVSVSEFLRGVLVGVTAGAKPPLPVIVDHFDQLESMEFSEGKLVDVKWKRATPVPQLPVPLPPGVVKAICSWCGHKTLDYAEVGRLCDKLCTPMALPDKTQPTGYTTPEPQPCTGWMRPVYYPPEIVLFWQKRETSE